MGSVYQIRGILRQCSIFASVCDRKGEDFSRVLIAWYSRKETDKMHRISLEHPNKTPAVRGTSMGIQTSPHVEVLWPKRRGSEPAKFNADSSKLP